MRKILAFIGVLVALVAVAVLGQSTLASAASATPAATATAPSAIAWPKSVIYVYDTTAGLKKSDGTQVWPVKAAAARWSKDGAVDVRYTSTGCPAKVQCVTIRQSELDDPTVGVTATSVAGSTITASNITLDTTFGRKNSAARRQNVVCHEMGHSLGMKHRNTTSSCMNPYVTSERYPDATDLKTLKTMYAKR
jgi:hypothetical protein